MAEHDAEDEYFKRLDAEKKAKLREELALQEAAKEKEARQKLHHHRCGKCGAPMITQLFKGVEIEGCPECGATLLDKGELQTLAGQDRSGVLAGLADLFGGKKS